MKISIITLFPKMIESFINESIIKRAIDKKFVEIEIINLRDFAKDKYRTVDDRPYGGGAGMVLKVDIVYAALNKIKTQKSKIILTSPKGIPFNQKKAFQLSKLDHVIILSGHYEGFDERILNYVDEEISLGDFVLTGGEIAASAIIDSIVRLVPQVLKKDSAIESESFFEVSLDTLINAVGKDTILQKLKQRGQEKVMLLEYPQYTRPEIFESWKVPDELLTGNHKEIEKWRLLYAYKETVKKRIDLLQ